MLGTPYPTTKERAFLGAMWALGTATHAQIVAELARRGADYESSAPAQTLRRLCERGLSTRTPAPPGTRSRYVYAAHPRDALGSAIVEGL